MSDQNGLTATLAERFGLTEWRDANLGEEYLFVWQFFLADDDVDGWRPERIRSLTVPGAPPLQRSIWRRKADDSLLSIDAYENTSRHAGHDQLLHLLGDFQATDLGRDESGEFGDVAFKRSGETVALYGRANLTILIRNAGPTVVPVRDAATALDRTITQPPPPSRPAPEIVSFAPQADRVAVGDPVPLDVRTVDPHGLRVRHFIRSRLGEVSRRQETLMYEPASPGAEELTLHAVNERGGVAVSSVSVRVVGR
jgi:hypothetical protein